MPLDRAVMAEFRKRRQNGLFAVAVELTGRAKVLATRHNDNGTRRNSITQTKAQDGKTVYWGIPLSSAPHAPHLEFGFKPHWVPARYIGLWASRHNVGNRETAVATLHGATRRRRYVTRTTYKTVRSIPLGLFVGGPGSTLDYARGGARGRLFAKGGKLRIRTYKTKGASNRLLTSGTVGHPILQPAAAQIGDIPPTVYQRGFQAGGGGLSAIR